MLLLLLLSTPTPTCGWVHDGWRSQVGEVSFLFTCDFFLLFTFLFQNREVAKQRQTLLVAFSVLRQEQELNGLTSCSWSQQQQHKKGKIPLHDSRPTLIGLPLLFSSSSFPDPTEAVVLICRGYTHFLAFLLPLSSLGLNSCSCFLPA